MPITTNFNRGAILLIPFPFSDQTSSKIRPAVVVSPPYPSDDLLVVAVTSVGEKLRPGEFPIQFWREAGLIHPSFAKRAVASVASNLVRKQLGLLREADLAKLDEAIRLWFGLGR
ncbi:MAG: type II toxin-antitoxin system PemK/MazF family toxin [Verrucomicrobiota bacterium]|nr:type II toxin-antitoxin system PemK/MazF family toxin [Verrucomicrobiota bacterium]